jgi:hypothetical protein
MNPVRALTLTPPVVERVAQVPALTQARAVHGVDAVHVPSVDSSRLDPRWGA